VGCSSQSANHDVVFDLDSRCDLNRPLWPQASLREGQLWVGSSRSGLTAFGRLLSVAKGYNLLLSTGPYIGIQWFNLDVNMVSTKPVFW